MLAPVVSHNARRVATCLSGSKDRPKSWFVFTNHSKELSWPCSRFVSYI